MYLKNDYPSPLGTLTIVADERFVKGVWFEDQAYFGANYDLEHISSGENEVILQVKTWLDDYFSGKNPPVDHTILAPEATEFRQKVFSALLAIPYGQTASYKEIAAVIAKQTGKAANFSRAVGGAVGHNPIAILIPCHRVLGSDGSLTGYAGGLERKIALLEFESENKPL